MLLVGVGLNSSGDPLLCWELMLGKGVRLSVGLSGGGGSGESGVWTWAGLGVELNSSGKGLWLTDSKLLVRACTVLLLLRGPA